MARRNSISTALEAPQGKAAFSETPEPAAAAPARRRRGKGPEWEAENKLRAFYCPQDIWDTISDEVAKGDRSKTQIIVAALREYLNMPENAE